MNPSLHKFNAALDEVAKKLDINLVTVTKKVAVEAFKNITELTPVDTGRARASWDMSLGSPSDFLPPDIDPAKRGERKKLKKKGVEAQMENVALAQEAKAYDVVSRIDAKQPIYIVSNLPYIDALEHGWSQKAPAGMVRITLAALEIAFARFLAKP